MKCTKKKRYFLLLDKEDLEYVGIFGDQVVGIINKRENGVIYVNVDGIRGVTFSNKIKEISKEIYLQIKNSKEGYEVH